jgi:hypothetical protein
MFIKPALLSSLLLVPVALAVPAPLSPSSDKPSTSLDVRYANPSETTVPSSGASYGSAPGNSERDSGNSTTGSSSGGSPANGVDFSIWDLQLPVGTPGNPETIAGSKLSTYTDPKKEYYYTDSSTRAIVMKVPGSPASTGCVTTTNSKHCRTEFDETTPASWDPKAATNSMTSTLMVVKADNSQHGTCIGQIHIEESVSVRPVAELYYNSQGELSMGVEQTRQGGDETVTTVGSVPVGTKFSYTIAYENNELSVVINGGEKKVLSTYQLDAPPSYFKAGNYNQGSDSSEIHFFGIEVKH